jgi:L-2-hydroxycarboxylate dehydrogenase (NAD+)
MPDLFHVVPEGDHNRLVEAAYRARGFEADESSDAVRLCADAARHGIHTHNALKALHLDRLFGSGSKGCVPGARIRELPSRFFAARVWDANRKLGPSAAYRAMEEAVRLADAHGVGIVSVDNAFHYLWGGGYVMAAAKRGYLAYTNCTATLAEVVPFGGKTPTLGTNPHSWGFPTTEAIGFPIVVDWATSVMSFGRVQQFRREGKALPPGAAVDAKGNPTTDASAAAALLPFGAHKGYGLALADELMAAMIGGSLPTLRGRWADDGKKHTSAFFFQAIHPDAMSGGAFAGGRNQAENLRAVVRDILGHGNEKAALPGQPEAEWAARSAAAGGLLFTRAEVDAFDAIAVEVGLRTWRPQTLKIETL